MVRLLTRGGRRPPEPHCLRRAGKAARNWECFDAIVEALKSLENDETLLVQSGRRKLWE